MAVQQQPKAGSPVKHPNTRQPLAKVLSATWKASVDVYRTLTSISFQGTIQGTGKAPPHNVALESISSPGQAVQRPLSTSSAASVSTPKSTPAYNLLDLVSQHGTSACPSAQPSPAKSSNAKPVWVKALDLLAPHAHASKQQPPAEHGDSTPIPTPPPQQACQHASQPALSTPPRPADRPTRRSIDRPSGLPTVFETSGALPSVGSSSAADKHCTSQASSRTTPSDDRPSNMLERMLRKMTPDRPGRSGGHGSEDADTAPKQSHTRMASSGQVVVHPRRSLDANAPTAVEADDRPSGPPQLSRATSYKGWYERYGEQAFAAGGPGCRSFGRSSTNPCRVPVVDTDRPSLGRPQPSKKISLKRVFGIMTSQQSDKSDGHGSGDAGTAPKQSHTRMASSGQVVVYPGSLETSSIAAIAATTDGRPSGPPQLSRLTSYKGWYERYGEQAFTAGGPGRRSMGGTRARASPTSQMDAAAAAAVAAVDGAAAAAAAGPPNLSRKASLKGVYDKAASIERSSRARIEAAAAEAVRTALA